MTFRNGLSSLLRPEDSVLVLIDHQPYQLANVNSHEPQMVINNTAGLAKAAKAFGVPTILTTVIAERGGLLFPQITEVFPGQEVYPEPTSFGVTGFPTPIPFENFCFLALGGGTYETAGQTIFLERLDPFPESGHALSQPIGSGTVRACDGQ